MSNRCFARDSSLELYRIIVMLFIVAHHAVMNPACVRAIDAMHGNVSDFLLLCMGAWGKVGIDCFVLITGYFMCQKNISAQKFIRLYLEVVFYRVVINAFFIFAGDVRFSWLLIIDSLFPVRRIADGFTSSFLVFFLCIPFLNVLVNNLTRRQHRMLIALTVGVFSVLSSLPKFTVVFNYVEWFCILYFISSYLRLHSAPWMENRRLFGWLSLAAFLAGCGTIFLNVYLLPKLFNVELNACLWLVDSNRITALIPACCFFLYFKNLQMNYSKWINGIASTTFGVLLIHANSKVMHDWLFQDVCRCYNWPGSLTGLLMAIGSIIVIFCVCALIDYLRQRFIENIVKIVPRGRL